MQQQQQHILPLSEGGKCSILNETRRRNGREKFESYQLFTTPDTNACRCYVKEEGKGKKVLLRAQQWNKNRQQQKKVYLIFSSLYSYFDKIKYSIESRCE